MDLLNILNLYSFNFVDIMIGIIDIAIVAFVLYKLMMLIRGTRAVQLLKGLVVLLVGTAASDWLGFDTIHWIMRQIMPALVVALPIVFQPELRRALEKIGGGRFMVPSLTLMEEDDRSSAIETIVQSTRRLAQTRTGALIVLEKTTGLEEYIDTGIFIDAVLTEELLMNIFVEKSPLHDGAAIIRGNRIAVAACVLPLSSNPNLPRELGTRHRAAAGITEQSDALAIVVSEETGTISVAMEGTLSRHLASSELREKLSQTFQPRYSNIFSSFRHRR